MLLKDVDSKIKGIVSKLCMPESDSYAIEDDTDLVNDLGFSSVEIIQLIVQIENEFDFEFADADLSLAKIGKYAQLRDYIMQKVV